jgi:hypothetical protein
MGSDRDSDLGTEGIYSASVRRALREKENCMSLLWIIIVVLAVIGLIALLSRGRFGSRV